MRDTRFTFVCSRDERELLADLSARLSRSQSDVVRLLIREACARKQESAGGPSPFATPIADQRQAAPA